MVFVGSVMVLLIAFTCVLANARARRNLEALSEPPHDQRRADDTDPPPSSSGYRGSVG